ncbi:Hsp70 chaperone [Entomophthora muscae]|uniref:Hsp70 chaperone n=1 Tax=Entomophthora muscae TaxID=34485 RepID=A0ACC2TEC2_9FUNG|nr:Hsp70 chaperone [Entomophthora muscae]
MEEKYALGIDLGTTNSCCGVYKDGQVKMIPNRHGSILTPSWVAFSDEEGHLVGEDAVEQAVWNLSNSIFHVKRFMGRKFSDNEVQESIRRVPFDVVGDSGDIKIRVKDHKVNRDLEPEEISAMILSSLKADAEEFLGTKITNAVITVPAYFNNAQRQATKDAGTIAGLNVVKLLNEPTAAALAYSVEKKKAGKQFVLVFDIGGGTFDVAILLISDGEFKVCAVAGDCSLGGADFDQRLFDYCKDKFCEEKNSDFSHDKRAVARLREMCEKAKKKLSTVQRASIAIDSFFDDEDLNIPVSQLKIEELCKDLFEKTKDGMDSAIADASISKFEIGSVLMVGGSTRIPYIRRMVTKYFEKKPTHTLNPDEAVAQGAAIEAWRLTSTCDKTGGILLMDVTPLSLGTDIVGDEMTILIPKNTPIPACFSAVFNNYVDFQTSMEFKVFEGERLQAHANHLLGQFILNGIAPQPKGKSCVKATFEIDANGILDVTAADLNSGNYSSITINDLGKKLSKEEIQKMIAEGEKHRAFDQAFKNQREARGMFQDYLDSLNAIANATNVPPTKKAVALVSYKVGKDWLQSNMEASQLVILERLERLKNSTRFT